MRFLFFIFIGMFSTLFADGAVLQEYVNMNKKNIFNENYYKEQKEQKKELCVDRPMFLTELTKEIEKKFGINCKVKNGNGTIFPFFPEKRCIDNIKDLGGYINDACENKGEQYCNYVASVIFYKDKCLIYVENR